MKTLTVDELKNDLAAALDSVKSGEQVQITEAEQGQPVALLTPPDHVDVSGPRPLGLYAGRVKVVFHDDWAMTDDELLRS